MLPFELPLEFPFPLLAAATAPFAVEYPFDIPLDDPLLDGEVAGTEAVPEGEGGSGVETGSIRIASMSPSGQSLSAFSPSANPHATGHKSSYFRSLFTIGI